MEVPKVYGWQERFERTSHLDQTEQKFVAGLLIHDEVMRIKETSNEHDQHMGTVFLIMNFLAKELSQISAVRKAHQPLMAYLLHVERAALDSYTGKDTGGFQDVDRMAKMILASANRYMADNEYVVALHARMSMTWNRDVEYVDESVANSNLINQLPELLYRTELLFLSGQTSKYSSLIHKIQRDETRKEFWLRMAATELSKRYLSYLNEILAESR